MRILPLICLCAVVSTAGCGPSRPSISSSPFRGPAVTLASDGGFHEVRLEAPSGGWGLIVDQVVQRRGGYDIFATIRRPDGRFLHSQGFVTHRATTSLATQIPVTLCVRELTAEVTAGSQEYEVVIK